VRFLISFVFFLLLIVGECAYAQTDSSGIPQQGLQDSVVGGPLRPRRGTYIVEVFPSPAPAGSSITFQYYNHTPQEIAVRIVDILERPVWILQERTFMPNGLHKFSPFASNKLSSGLYFVRLITYTPTGDIDQTEDTPFIIAR